MLNSLFGSTEEIFSKDNVMVIENSGSLKSSSLFGWTKRYLQLFLAFKFSVFDLYNSRDYLVIGRVLLEHELINTDGLIEIFANFVQNGEIEQSLGDFR